VAPALALAGLQLFLSCAGTRGRVPSSGTPAGEPLAQALPEEREALRQKLKATQGKPAPELLRDLGWAELVAGEVAEAEKLLTQAGQAGVRDPRIGFALALLAHESGQNRRARELWLALLDGLTGPGATTGWAAPLAELAAHRLLGLSNDGGGMPAERALRDRLAGLWQKRAALPEEAQQLLAALYGQQLRLLGDEAGALKVDGERGCPSAFYVTGPSGHLPSLDLLSSFPADDPSRDAQRGRYRRMSGVGCSLSLEGVPGRAGVFHATAWAELGAPAELPLTIETGAAPWALYIDGKRVFYDAEPVRRQALALQLPAGRHALTVKIGVDSGAHVQLAVPGARFFDGPVAAMPRADAPKGEVAARVRALSKVPTDNGGWQGVLGALVRGQQAYGAGDAETGLQVIEPALAAAPKFPSLSLLFAGLVLEDRSRPERLARDQARSQLEMLVALRPELLRPRLSLASMLIQDEKAEPALELLDTAPPSREPSWQLALLRAKVLKSRGWTVEAEQSVAEARRIAPTACQAIEPAVDQRREQADVKGALLVARELSACNPYNDRLADELVDAGRLDDALREYERLLKLEPESSEWQRALARVLTLRRRPGDLDRAAGLYERLIERAPKSTGPYLDLANLRIAAGQRDAGRAVLKRGLTESPEAPDLRQALLALGEADPLDAVRLDGKQVIREFVRSGHTRFEGEAAVLVLDRTVVRVLQNGGRLALTHNIIRVLNKDGLAKFGEVNIPEGADVLTLRTVKADGKTTREPEEIPDKDTVSAPDLEVGDYVEFEYVDRDPPQSAFPGGFLAERFYFASADAPLDRSEYLLMVPADMPLQIDTRGPLVAASGAGADGKAASRDVPRPTVRRVGDEQHYFWERHRVARIQPEPPWAQGQLDDWMPSVRVGSGLSFERYVNFLRERRFRTLRLTRELRALAAKLAGPPPSGSEPPESLVLRALRLDEWVRKNIRQGGSLDEPASSVLLRREGRRDTLLLALLHAAGIPAEVWLVRPRSAPDLSGPLPDLLAYGEFLIAVAPGRGDGGQPLFFLDPVFRHLPGGYVRPLLRSARAVRLIEEWGRERELPPVQKAEFVEVKLPPEGGAPAVFASAQDPLLRARAAALADSRRLDMRVQLGADGGGEVTVRERLTGWPALEWREQVENISEDKLRQQLEQRALGFYFPGASLIDLKYGPMDDDGAALTVEYRFNAPQLARRRAEGDQRELVLPAPYPLLLSRNYISVPTRQTPLLLHYVLPTTLEAEVALPEGAKVQAVARPIELNGFGRFVQRAAVEGKLLRLHSETTVPLLRVLPERYPAFVEFAARLDAAEEGVAVIAVPK
jgi:tetratricopeptide (TPR) repeat protein